MGGPLSRPPRFFCVQGEVWLTCQVPAGRFDTAFLFPEGDAIVDDRPDIRRQTCRIFFLIDLGKRFFGPCFQIFVLFRVFQLNDDSALVPAVNNGNIRSSKSIFTIAAYGKASSAKKSRHKTEVIPFVKQLLTCF